MTVKHKMYELEEQELLQEFNDGYISKQEYEAQLKALKNSRKITEIRKDKHVSEEDN